MNTDIGLLIDTDRKVIYGAKETIKALRQGQIDHVFLALNCPAHVRRTVESLASANQIKLNAVDLSSEELSTQCKKTFSIAVAGILRTK
jgi:ribosomal protein L30E